MLTKQHRFATKIINCHQRRLYKRHMCGLCHALGDHYGLAHRLLTSHEMILLNLLTSAQRPGGSEVVMRRCPLNPTRMVATNRDNGSEFAAAVAVELAKVSLNDDIQDTGGRNIGARLAGWALKRAHQTALKRLEALNFPVDSLTRLGERQTSAEQDDNQDPARPTAMTSAKLFMMTARLSQDELAEDKDRNAENEVHLAKLGTYYGAYLYLADAYRDYTDDMARGHYNPLRRFSLVRDDEVILSPAGLAWLIVAGCRLANAAADANDNKWQAYSGPAVLEAADLAQSTSDRPVISTTIWIYSLLLQLVIFCSLLLLIGLSRPAWGPGFLIIILGLYAGLHLRMILAAPTWGLMRQSRPLLSGYYNYFALSLLVIDSMPIYLQVGYGLCILGLLGRPWYLSLSLWRKGALTLMPHAQRFEETPVKRHRNHGQF